MNEQEPRNCILCGYQCSPDDKSGGRILDDNGVLYRVPQEIKNCIARRILMGKPPIPPNDVIRSFVQKGNRFE